MSNIYFHCFSAKLKSKMPRKIRALVLDIVSGMNSDEFLVKYSIENPLLTATSFSPSFSTKVIFKNNILSGYAILYDRFNSISYFHRTIRPYVERGEMPSSAFAMVHNMNVSDPNTAIFFCYKSRS